MIELNDFMTTARRRPWAAIVGGLLFLGGSVVGFVYSDYSEFTKSRREELGQFYQELGADRRELDPVIMAFVAKAKNGAEVPEDKRDELTMKMVQVRNRAEQVAAVLPEARSETNNLVDAMATFRTEALKMTGPADARPFWEALGRLDDAEQALRSKVTSIQNSYVKRVTS